MTFLYVDGGASLRSSLPSSVCATNLTGDQTAVNGQHGFYNAASSVSKLTLYASDGHFNGLKIEWHDGSSDTGVAHNADFKGTDDPQTLELNRGETVKRVDVFTGEDKRVVGVRIVTTQGTDKTLGQGTGTLTSLSGQALGTGILSGVFGHEGWGLNSLGFLFSNDIVSESLTNLVWHLDEQQLLTQQPLALQHATVINNSDVTQSVQVSFSASTSDADQWSREDSRSFGQSFTVGVEGDFSPVKVSASTTISFEEGYTVSKGGTHERTTDHALTTTLVVEPHKAQEAHAQVTASRVSVPWAATWTQTLSNGATSESQITGVFTGTALDDYRVVFDATTAVPAGSPPGVSTTHQDANPTGATQVLSAGVTLV